MVNMTRGTAVGLDNKVSPLTSIDGCTSMSMDKVNDLSKKLYKRSKCGGYWVVSTTVSPFVTQRLLQINHLAEDVRYMSSTDMTCTK